MKGIEKCLDFILNKADIYLPEQEMLFFLYSDMGHIAIYHNITKEEFDNHIHTMRNAGEEWLSSTFGPGGQIVDIKEAIELLMHYKDEKFLIVEKGGAVYD